MRMAWLHSWHPSPTCHMTSSCCIAAGQSQRAPSRHQLFVYYTRWPNLQADPAVYLSETGGKVMSTLLQFESTATRCRGFPAASRRRSKLCFQSVHRALSPCGTSANPPRRFCLTVSLGEQDHG